MLLLLLCLNLAGNAVEALTYDYSASIECFAQPIEPQYGGGMMMNPEFDNGLQGWGAFGRGNIEVRTSSDGNRFVVAYNRTQTQDSFTQMLYLDEGKFYTFSAWIQISEGSDTVVAVFKTQQDNRMVIGYVMARSGCWSMLKGGFSVNVPGQAELYFENGNSNVEIWADSLSLQPFATDEWRGQQYESIEKIRKRNVRFHVVDQDGKTLQGAVLSIEQRRRHFPLGCATAETILTHKAYQDWFTPRFTATTFDNEMKWYATEINRGKENYSVPDAMMSFAKQHKISVRGHNVFWDNIEENPQWVKSLSPEELKAATTKRMDSVVSRYAGQVIGWDVVNENLHYSFFENTLGPNASADFFQRAQQLDPNTTMFINEFNTLEHPRDGKSTPAKILELLREIKSFPGNEWLLAGIGLESHFNEPNIPYMRACLDTLGATRLPIWLTELDVARGPNQAQLLEEIMREGYSHPSVEGIIVWAGWKPTGCSEMCLTDNSFNNLPAGDVVDKLIKEWRTEKLDLITGSEDSYEQRLFHGEYIITAVNPTTNSSLIQHLEVTKETSETLEVWIAV